MTAEILNCDLTEAQFNTKGDWQQLLLIIISLFRSTHRPIHTTAEFQCPPCELSMEPSQT